MTHDQRPKACLIFPEQHPEAARVLGRAFINDPATRAILPEVEDPASRAKRLALLFSVVMQINRRHGQPILGVVENSAVVAAAVIEGAFAPSMTASIVSGSGKRRE